jgi:ribose 1,5-bisphosphokinase PhnN
LAGLESNLSNISAQFGENGVIAQNLKRSGLEDNSKILEILSDKEYDTAKALSEKIFAMSTSGVTEQEVERLMGDIEATLTSGDLTED